MNRIDNKFRQLKDENRKALITFVTAGDPDIKTTMGVVREMEKSGADIIELGIPYSDPIAEGPVIQRANERAMKNGIKISDVINVVRELRKDLEIPLVFLLYYNCVLQYGIDEFFKDCADAGIDGVIIPDLPYEEKEEIKDSCENYGVYPIAMVAPTSRERMKNIVKDARGFIYCVSSLGVTGMREKFNTDFEEFFAHIDSVTNLPKALGFGISTEEHVRKLKGYCDGLILGSAIVRKVEEGLSYDEVLSNVGGFVMELRKAVDE